MTTIEEQIALAIEAQRDHFMLRTDTPFDHPIVSAYNEAARVARQFEAPLPRYAADDDCAICNNPRAGRHDDHQWQPRLPPEEWARPTPEQREFMRKERERHELERTAAEPEVDE